MSDAKFSVGQRVWVYDVNARKGAEPQEATVSKVGRQLVTVQRDWWEKKYRIDTGQMNGPYSSHSWILTDEERDDTERRAALFLRLKDYGVEFQFGRRISTWVLEGFAQVIDEDSR